MKPNWRVDTTPVGLLGKIRSVAPVIVPLVSNALSRATVLGLTIISVVTGPKRTRYGNFFSTAGILA